MLKIITVIALICFTAILLLVYGENNSNHEEYLKPMYGNMVKTPEQIAIDRQFVEEASKAAGDNSKAAAHLRKSAWEMIRSGDLSTAMKRFNQSWLLKDDAYETFWGFAVVAAKRGDFATSNSMFEKAIQLARSVPERLLCDAANSFFSGSSKHSVDALRRQEIDKGLALLQRPLSNRDPCIDHNIQIGRCLLRSNLDAHFRCWRP